MCGRFSLLAHQELIRDRFGIEEFEFEITPRYNIAPTQKVATVIRDDKTRLVGMRWGLIPHWSRDMKIGNRMINARAETLAEKRSFKHPFKKKRCLILSTGFYEWQKTDDGKQPMYIRLKSAEPFALAGIYSHWKAPTEKVILSCSIITTTPNAVLSPIHNRMPVILRPDDEAIWIDPSNEDLESLQELLVSYENQSMEAYPISTYVNNPRNEGPMCTKPLT
jgi:putative SOS response-associated peptidase YedK